MEIFDIHKFDKYREDNRREVKKAKGGFYTTGLQDAAKIKKIFWDTINNRTKVSVNLLMDDDVKTYDMDGDVIMVIHVPRAKREQRPVYINNDIWNGTFRRSWEGDFILEQ